MREIKFRAWTGDRMFEPYYFERAYDGYEMPYKCYEDWRDLEDGRSQFCEIMQYTGLKDKNGKEIYESDRLKDRSGYIWIVFWHNDHACFGVKSVDNNAVSEIIDNENMEVIGNIYDNTGKVPQD